MKTNIFSCTVLWSDNAILVYLALAKLVIHLLTANNYGYFGDELYWLAMSRHLDFGYVDVPPLVAYLGAFSRWLIGDSLFAIHILPAIAGAIMVYLAGLIARELGGGRFAQWFTALMVMVAPIWLMFNSWFAYDPFDQLCTILVLYSVVFMIKQETPRRWIVLGILIGIGIMIKLSMIFLGFGLVIAWSLTNLRKSFITIWPWLAILIATAICMPFMAWQSNHGWPLLTYWRNYALNRPHQEPLQFLKQLALYLNPAILAIWIMGLYYLVFHREGKQYRALGLVYLILLVFFNAIMKFESRMLVSACFPLLAAGAVRFEKIITIQVAHWKGIKLTKFVYFGILLISSVWLAPFFLPVLPVAAFEKYFNATPDFVKENFDYYKNRFPLQFAFRFGWPEFVREIADVYHRLPEAERKKCVIWAANYGEAGAIDLIGKKYGLPDASSTHLSYYIWGPGQSRVPAGHEVVIAIGTLPIGWIFDEFTQVTMIKGSPYGVYWERYTPVYICRKPKTSLKEVWQSFKAFY